jgi:hypothetical protein
MKDRMISTQSKEKARKSASITSFQPQIRYPTSVSQEHKGIQIGNKLSLFTNNVIINIQNSNYCTKKYVE